MVSFTSGRERRLWAWTLAVVVAIYATLGLARTLSDELRNRDLLDNTFFTAFVVLVVAVVVRALRLRRSGGQPGVVAGQEMARQPEPRADLHPADGLPVTPLAPTSARVGTQ